MTTILNPSVSSSSRKSRRVALSFLLAASLPGSVAGAFESATAKAHTIRTKAAEPATSQPTLSKGVRITFGEPEFIDDAQESSTLGARVSAALLGKDESKSSRKHQAERPSPSKSPSTADEKPNSRADHHGNVDRDNSNADKTWRCGPWEELWQGHGAGRTCEWR
ncbi:MAG TPA: hypothetical protein VHM70_09065 [Polyangiaceae bacterium]|jgi:hypothetical protein|nr:hypothetical protein [Polyangiaceae bacterium]